MWCISVLAALFAASLADRLDYSYVPPPENKYIPPPKNNYIPPPKNNYIPPEKTKLTPRPPVTNSFQRQPPVPSIINNFQRQPPVPSITNNFQRQPPVPSTTNNFQRQPPVPSITNFQRQPPVPSIINNFQRQPPVPSITNNFQRQPPVPSITSFQRQPPATSFQPRPPFPRGAESQVPNRYTRLDYGREVTLNHNPGTGRSAPMGRFVGACAASLVCVPEAMCNPYTGFVRGGLLREPTGPSSQPTVSLLRCYRLKEGGIGDGVCCQMPHINDPWPDQQRASRA